MKPGLHVIPIGLGGRTDELLEHARRMNGACHKMLDPLTDRELLRGLMERSPDSEWVLRNHQRSEDKGRILVDPAAVGHRHAEEWAREMEMLGLRGSQRVLVEGVNEWIPSSAPQSAAINAYSLAFLQRLMALGLRGLAPLFSVGWPDGTDVIADWHPYTTLLAFLRANPHHGLALHEYWPGAGPAEGWGYLAGRLMHVPVKGLRVYITECGNDDVNDTGQRGWREWGLSADQAAGQIVDYTRRIATLGFDIRGIHPFTSGGAGEWDSFSMLGRPNEVLAAYAGSAGSAIPLPPPPAGGAAMPLPEIQLVNWPDWVGPIVRPANLKAGDRYWRLVKAEMDPANPDLHHIYLMAPRGADNVVIIRNRGNGEEHRLDLNQSGEFPRDWPMWRHTPDGNAYDVSMDGLPSDAVQNLHLEGNRHVSFKLWYERATVAAVAAPVPPPQPIPPQPQAVEWGKAAWAVEQAARILEAEGRTATAAWLLGCDSYVAAKARR